MCVSFVKSIYESVLSNEPCCKQCAHQFTGTKMGFGSLAPEAERNNALVKINYWKCLPYFRESSLRIRSGFASFYLSAPLAKKNVYASHAVISKSDAHRPAGAQVTTYGGAARSSLLHGGRVSAGLWRAPRPGRRHCGGYVYVSGKGKGVAARVMSSQKKKTISTRGDPIYMPADSLPLHIPKTLL